VITCVRRNPDEDLANPPAKTLSIACRIPVNHLSRRLRIVNAACRMYLVASVPAAGGWPQSLSGGGDRSGEEWVSPVAPASTGRLFGKPRSERAQQFLAKILQH
jgi:hypothetical protein